MNLNKQFPTFKKICEKITSGHYPNTVINYCVRITVFLILGRNFFLNLMFPIYNFIYDNILKEPKEDLFLDLGAFIFFSLMCHVYITIKLCGLFKKIKHLNFFIGLVIAILIDFLLCYSKTITVQLSPFKIVFSNHLEIFLVVLPCFVIFKFLDGLANTIQIPFKQIGYFFSIEFYKDLYKKLLNKLINKSKTSD